MASFVLALYADRLAPKAHRAPLSAGNRVIYVRAGDATIRSGGQVAALAGNSAWHGAAGCEVAAGANGAALLRWELAPAGAAPAGEPLLAHGLELADPGGYLMRCDRVDFPPGGIAYTHTHRGPGIRCLLAGGIRVEVNGRTQDVQPGGAWFEAGPDPVRALASGEPTGFARVMILPRSSRGKSSIRYVLPEDQDKPKTQQYQIFCDEPITL